jgi:hypothetical protein
MRKTILPLAAAGLLFAGFAFDASAATVKCPGALSATLTRQVQVSGALAGGYCNYQSGNFNGDDFSAYFAAYTLIDKDVAAGTGDTAEGGLRYTVDTSGRISGTWTMFDNYWNTYGQVYLAMHFGNGKGNPDSFIVELDPWTLTGNWALLPANLANGLSNIYLIGRGTASSSSSSTSSTSSGPDTSTSSGTVPDSSSTLTLLGLGLLGLGYGRRWRKAG